MVKEQEINYCNIYLKPCSYKCRFIPIQKMQLDIILTSLQDNSHVATLLGFSSSSSDNAMSPRSLHTSTQLSEVLMKTLLRNLGFYVVCNSKVFV